MSNTAEITKAQVVIYAGNTVLIGVAEKNQGEEYVNFRVPFAMEALDEDAFIKELKDKIADDFEMSQNGVDVHAEHLLKKMRSGTLEARLKGFIA